jgi:chromate transporter
MADEVVWLFVLSGLMSMILKSPPHQPRLAGPSSFVASSVLAMAAPSATMPATLTALSLFFLKAGAFVFGSGLAIVPFLYGGVVVDHQWLTETQFLDAVAIAMITPGPVVITAAFIGYLVAGLPGAVVAALAVFIPPYLTVIAGAPHYRRIAGNRQVKAFVQGVTAAAVGAIAGAAWILGTRAITDLPTAAIAGVTLALLQVRTIPEPLLIVAAGIIGAWAR